MLAFRHPLTREVAYGTQLADRRRATHAAAARATIELEPDRLDELAGLVAHHMEKGGETLEAARWFARAAHWAGHSQPRDALRLWQRVTELADELEESEETTALALLSRMLQLEYAWRLGMDREQAEALAAEAAEIAGRCGDLNSLALLKLLTSARPGVAETSSEWVARRRRGGRTWPTNRASPTCGSRSAAPPPTPTCAPAISTASKRRPTRCWSSIGGDPELGAGIVDRLPDRLGADGQSRRPARARHGPRRPSGCSTRRCAIADRASATPRPRAGRWAPRR